MNKKTLLKLFSVLMIFSLFALSSCDNSSDKDADVSKTINLSDYKGKVVILDFWATWCPPCRAGIPDLVELKEKYGDKNFEIIGISLDAITRGGATKNDVEPFIDDFEINYPIVIGDAAIMNKYGGIQSIPTSFVLDQDGRIVSQYVGLTPKSTYEDDIERILAGETKKDQKVPAPNFSFPVVNAE